MANTIGAVLQRTTFGQKTMTEARAYRAAMSGLDGSVARGLRAEMPGRVSEIDDMLRHRAGGDDLTAMSGNALGIMRAGGQSAVLERKIAARKAAGKNTIKLEKQLNRARQSAREIAFVTRPGEDVFNVKQVTLREVQQAQVGARSTPGMTATARRGSLSGVHKTKVFGEGIPEMMGNPDKELVNIRRVKSASGAADTFEAIHEKTGRRITLRDDVGKTLMPDANEVGLTGNALASSHRGQITQRIHGYMQGAMGYGNMQRFDWSSFGWSQVVVIRHAKNNGNNGRQRCTN